MRALLEETWSRLGFEDPAFVDRLLTRGTLAGAVGGVLGVVWELLASSQAHGAVAVAWACAALILALPRQSMAGLVALVVSMGLLVTVMSPSSSSLMYYFSLPLGLVLALEPLSPARRLAAFIGPTVGASWALFVARWLGARHLGSAATATLVPQVVAGLFVAAGAASAWLTLAADTMEPKLNSPKVLHAWQRVRGALQRVGDVGSRHQLEALTRAGAERWVKAEQEWATARASIDNELEEETRAAVLALEERLERTADAELKEHLTQLLRVHRDTLEQLEGLRRKVDRAEARVAAEAGWLETAAFSIELAPRSTVGLGDLVGRLSSLSNGPNLRT